ncbi:IPExxxVDY family protein [Sphingobacterium hungaricum]|uniref:IPExxxVDY family protein n=1 Tax=Sphingobacterium hungaricum TaxID=2082723 RepID=A0A928UX45_9SPHI|nr:IPExxxVDY family protein [Sphingobacterium hungaricum]MBE8713583.1 IPExxxVDY family protein [Sphingobacterium hungaricum]
MNKVTFKLETDFDLELDFTLIGISTILRDYRLCHFINKHTGLKFIYGKEDHVDHKGQQKTKLREELDFHIIFERKKNKPTVKHHFTMYRFCSQTFEYEFYLLNNRSLEGGVLIPEAANFDYFLMIKHYMDEEDIQKLVDDIRKVNDILLIKEIDPIILKSKENLIF